MEVNMNVVLTPSILIALPKNILQNMFYFVQQKK